jgi:hypothetical protein
VITPHSAILNFSGPDSMTFFRRNSTLGDGTPVLDPDQHETNWVYTFPHIVPNEPLFPSALPPYNQNYLGFVQPGVTQMNFSFPINGQLHFNKRLFERSSSSYGFLTSVGTFEIKMELLDAQTQQTLEKVFSGSVDLFLNVNP